MPYNGLRLPHRGVPVGSNHFAPYNMPPLYHQLRQPPPPGRDSNHPDGDPIYQYTTLNGDIIDVWANGYSASHLATRRRRRHQAPAATTVRPTEHPHGTTGPPFIANGPALREYEIRDTQNGAQANVWQYSNAEISWRPRVGAPVIHSNMNGFPTQQHQQPQQWPPPQGAPRTVPVYPTQRLHNIAPVPPIPPRAQQQPAPPHHQVPQTMPMHHGYPLHGTMPAQQAPLQQPTLHSTAPANDGPTPDVLPRRRRRHDDDSDDSDEERRARRHRRRRNSDATEDRHRHRHRHPRHGSRRSRRGTDAAAQSQMPVVVNVNVYTAPQATPITLPPGLPPQPSPPGQHFTRSPPPPPPPPRAPNGDSTQHHQNPDHGQGVNPPYHGTNVQNSRISRPGNDRPYIGSRTRLEIYGSGEGQAHTYPFPTNVVDDGTQRGNSHTTRPSDNTNEDEGEGDTPGNRQRTGTPGNYDPVSQSRHSDEPTIPRQSVQSSEMNVDVVAPNNSTPPEPLVPSPYPRADPRLLSRRDTGASRILQSSPHIGNINRHPPPTATDTTTPPDTTIRREGRITTIPLLSNGFRWSLDQRPNLDAMDISFRNTLLWPALGFPNSDFSKGRAYRLEILTQFDDINSKMRRDRRAMTCSFSRLTVEDLLVYWSNIWNDANYQAWLAQKLARHHPNRGGDLLVRGIDVYRQDGTFEFVLILA